VSLFFAGLHRVGPTRASIISTAEPLTAVLLAFAIFGESMTLLQLAGGALVLGGVWWVSTPGRAGRTRVTRESPSPVAASLP
jgi:drug/metabolite transporter (DMT)-like permease